MVSDIEDAESGIRMVSDTMHAMQCMLGEIRELSVTPVGYFTGAKSLPWAWGPTGTILHTFTLDGI
jgi:hypothetical protein